MVEPSKKSKGSSSTAAAAHRRHRPSGISTNTIDNNEVSTNAIVQTKYMHKTNDNRNNKKQTSAPQVIEIK